MNQREQEEKHEKKTSAIFLAVIDCPLPYHSAIFPCVFLNAENVLRATLGVEVVRLGSSRIDFHPLLKEATSFHETRVIHKSKKAF